MSACIGTSTAALTDVEIRIGTPGAGSATGAGGSRSSAPAQGASLFPELPSRS